MIDSVSTEPPLPDPETPDPENADQPQDASADASGNTETEQKPPRQKTEAQRAAAARKRARRMAKLRAADEVAEILFERYPATFYRESRERKPLSIGLHSALLEQTKDELHRLEVQRFLSNYAHSLGYLHGVVARRERIDLAGEATGETIDDEMVSNARAEIDRIQERRTARGEGPTRGPASKTKRGPKKPGASRGFKRKDGNNEKGDLADELKSRGPRTAKIIAKRSRRLATPASETLMSQKLADAGLGSTPRKKLVLQKKPKDQG